jgi:hypothetical protein
MFLLLALFDNTLLQVADSLTRCSNSGNNQGSSPMTWDHRIAKVVPLAAMAIAAFVTIVTFMAYYH